MRADDVQDLRENEIAEAEFFLEFGAVRPDAVGRGHLRLNECSTMAYGVGQWKRSSTT
jgi:hypothetical protein